MIFAKTKKGLFAEPLITVAAIAMLSICFLNIFQTYQNIGKATDIGEYALTLSNDLLMDQYAFHRVDFAVEHAADKSALASARSGGLHPELHDNYVEWFYDAPIVIKDGVLQIQELRYEDSFREYFLETIDDELRVYSESSSLSSVRFTKRSISLYNYTEVYAFSTRGNPGFSSHYTFPYYSYKTYDLLLPFLEERILTQFSDLSTIPRSSPQRLNNQYLFQGRVFRVYYNEDCLLEDQKRKGNADGRVIFSQSRASTKVLVCIEDLGVRGESAPRLLTEFSNGDPTIQTPLYFFALEQSK